MTEVAQSLRHAQQGLGTVNYVVLADAGGITASVAGVQTLAAGGQLLHLPGGCHRDLALQLQCFCCWLQSPEMAQPANIGAEHGFNASATATSPVLHSSCVATKACTPLLYV